MRKKIEKNDLRRFGIYNSVVRENDLGKAINSDVASCKKKLSIVKNSGLRKNINNKSINKKAKIKPKLETKNNTNILSLEPLDLLKRENFIDDLELEAGFYFRFLWIVKFGSPHLKSYGLDRFGDKISDFDEKKTKNLLNQFNIVSRFIEQSLWMNEVRDICVFGNIPKRIKGNIKEFKSVLRLMANIFAIFWNKPKDKKSTDYRIYDTNYLDENIYK